MKKRLLFLWLMLLMMGFGGFAQTTVTIGTGTSSDYTFPFNNYYRNSWNEMIYPASLINEAGAITSIAFHVSAVPTSDYPFSTLTIYMGTSSDSVHTSTTSWLPMSDLTEVYTATNVSSPTDTGWLIIDLDTPFPYDGAENLVIVTSKTMANYTTGLKFYYTTGSSGCSMYRRNDSDASYANHPGSNTGTTSTYRPNLQLTFVPMGGDYCYAVRNLSATDVTTTDATIIWQSSESAIEYILQYKAAGQPWDENVTTVTTTDTVFYLSGLEAVNTYNVRVASYCGSDTSAWKTVTFSTPCEESWDILPYEEDFEGYATYSVPDCWTRMQTYTSGSTIYPYVNNASATAHNGTGYFYSYGGNNFFALPHFGESVNNLRLTLWMKPAGTTSAYGRVEVGVVSGLNNPNSFQQVAVFYADSIGSTNWQKYMIDFSDVAASDSDYIVIRRYVSSTYAWYFDDLSVDYIPSCEAPTELAFVGATTSSVTLKWNPGEESNFKVFYKALGDEDYTEVSGVYLDADSTYTLTSLESATNYTVYVSSVCFDGSETAGDPITCATTMEPVELPYTTDFSEDADQSWLLNNGDCLNYWTMGAIGDTVPGALFVTNNGTTPGYTVASAISMVSASKLFTIGTAPQVNISFDVMVGGESSFDYIKLFFSPENEIYPAKAGAVPTSSEYGYNSYSQYAFDFSDYFSQSTYTSSSTYPYRFNLTGGNVVHIDALMPNPHENPDENSTAQVVFVWRNDNSGGTQPGAIISNVTIDVPTCFRPENLVATNVTPQSADLSWDSGDANSWTVEYGTHGFTLGSGIVVDVTGNPETTLTGLADNTEYDVYVKTICDGEESPYKNLSFTTPCSGITILPQTWNMDSNLVAGTSTYPLPGCWSRISPSGTTVGYPYSYNSSTYAHSGTRSLYFYNSYPHAYAIMPYIDPAALDIHHLQVSFFARASTASAYPSLQVGVMTDPTDTSTFTVVQTFSLTTTYDSETFDVSFADYEGNGSYIAFRNVSTGSATNSFYVDDVTLMEIPTCSKAKNLAAIPTTHEADLTWTGLGSSYDLYYKAASDANYTTVQGVTLTDGYYTLSNLTAATEYSWYIVTNCDDGTTFTSNIANFVTACEGLTTVPQFWNFDDNLTAGTSTYPLPACWNRISTSTTTTQYPYSYNSSTYAISGTRSLYFYNSYLNSLAILPGIDPDMLNLTDLQISFYARLSSANENVRLLVGVMDSPSDASSFTVVDTIVLTNAHPVDPFIVTFDEYEGSGTYVAFKNVTVTGATVANSIYIDNVTLEEIPVCAAPTGTQIFPATYTANVYWENMDQWTYNIYIKEEDDTDYTVMSSLTFADSVLTLEELEASTTYNLYIATICGDGTESVTNVYTFTTLCVPEIAPFTENFDAGTTLPECWEKRAGLADNVFAGSVPETTTLGWNFSNTYVFGAHHPKLNIYGTSCKYWLISPDIDISALNTPSLTFKLALTDYGNANPIEDPTSQADDKFMVIISTNHGETWSEENATVWSNATGADHVYNQISYTGEEVVIDLSEYAGETIRIAFYGESTATGGDNDLHIDDVVVGEMPSCSAPNQLAVSDITDATATISWKENGDATSWVVEYGVEGFTLGTGDVVTVTDTFVTLTSLLDATHYDVYVKAVCGGGSYSNPWMTTFLTSCLPMSLPYSQNFDSYGTGSTAEFVDCWNRFNNYSTSTNYPYVSSSYAVSGNNSLYFYNTSSTYSVAVLPMIDPTVNPINTLQISFSMRTSATTSKMVIGAMTNPMDFSTFTPIDTVENTAASVFEGMVVPLSSYTGNAGYVALRLLNTGTSYLAYVDDIYLETLPSCPRPTQLTATASTINSVTLSWTNGGDETEWEIVYGTTGFDPETATPVAANTNPFTVQNLNGSTAYEFYVRAVCSATDQSNWSNAASGITECDGPVALPYTETFEGYAGTTYNTAGIAPVCWTTYSNNTTYGAPHITGSGSYHYVHSGTNSMVFTCSSAGADAYAALPDFNASLNTLTVNFWRAMESTSYGTLTVGYVTDLDDLANTFVTVATIPSLGSSAGDTISVAFTGEDIPSAGNICFHWQQNGTYYSCCIDDINVTTDGSTPVITDPTVATAAATAIGQTNATLNATISNPDNVNISAKGFEWKATTGGTYTQISGTGTGNTFTANLSSLTANTSYTFKAFIIYNGTTVYGSEMTFTTLPDDTPEPCDVPTGLTANNITKEGFDVSWNANANVNTWNIRYRQQNGQWTSATSNTNQYSITGLSAETNYEVQVQADCGDNNISDWSELLTVTTLVDGINSYLLNSITLYPNPANDVVNVECTMNNVQCLGIEVFDVFGKLINTVNVTDNPTRINVSGLANGIYFVRVTTDEGVATKTFVKK